MKEPRNLRKLVQDIDGLDWYSAKTEGLGDLYEGLLEKNASEKKSGAGQYFTPRPLIDSMVALVQPKAGEFVQDPAAGTGGFLIAADRFVKAQTDELFKLTEKQQVFQRTKAFYGVELVPDTHRLALMNLMLHDIDGDLLLGDSLSPLGTTLPKADVILTNPPFGTKKGGGLPTRDDFTFPTSNKQFAFLQHIYRGLKPGGRAAVDVLVSVVGTIGRVAVVPSSLAGANIARAVARVRTSALVGSTWIAAWLASPAVQARLDLDAREVARKTLNIETLSKLAVPLAPADEQRAVTSSLAKSLAELDTLTRGTDAAAGPLRDLDAAILAAAFRGELLDRQSESSRSV